MSTKSRVWMWKCRANGILTTYVKALQEEAGLNHIHLEITSRKKHLQRKKVTLHEDGFYQTKSCI